MSESQKIADLLSDENIKVFTMSGVIYGIDKASIYVTPLTYEELDEVERGGVKGLCFHQMLGFDLDKTKPLSISIDPRWLISMVREIRRHRVTLRQMMETRAWWGKIPKPDQEAIDHITAAYQGGWISDFQLWDCLGHHDGPVSGQVAIRVYERLGFEPLTGYPLTRKQEKLDE